MAKFNAWYLSDKEMAEDRLFAEGRAEFIVVDAKFDYLENSVSRLMVSLRVTDKNGKTGEIKDFFRNSKEAAKRMKGFLISMGMAHLYSGEGFEAHHILNGSGVCELYTNSYTDKTGVDRINTGVKFYVFPDKDKKEGLTEQPLKAVSLDDDIPF